MRSPYDHLAVGGQRGDGVDGLLRLGRGAQRVRGRLAEPSKNKALPSALRRASRYGTRLAFQVLGVLMRCLFLLGVLSIALACTPRAQPVVIPGLHGGIHRRRRAGLRPVVAAYRRRDGALCERSTVSPVRGLRRRVHRNVQPAQGASRVRGAGTPRIGTPSGATRRSVALLAEVRRMADSRACRALRTRQASLT